MGGKYDWDTIWGRNLFLASCGSIFFIKYTVEDKSLVIDKFESERALYIGNFPDGHIQKRLRERTNFDCFQIVTN